jgi:hypothetical protein
VANTLQRHVSSPRTVLGGRDTIVARWPGYLLNLGEDATDDVQLAEEGIAAADPRAGARSPVLPPPDRGDLDAGRLGAGPKREAYLVALARLGR